jgi:hypothetical protein
MKSGTQSASIGRKSNRGFFIFAAGLKSYFINHNSSGYAIVIIIQRIFYGPKKYFSSG